MSERSGVCDHGRLKRQCNECSLEQECQELRAALATMTAERDHQAEQWGFCREKLNAAERQARSDYEIRLNVESKLAALHAERTALKEELAEAEAEVQRLCLILAVESDDAFDVPFTEEQKKELAVDYDEWIADRKQRAEDAEVGKQIRLAKLRGTGTGSKP